jgi:hypothetical protein
MAGARQVVDSPDFTALPYGLWDTGVQQRPSGDPHWQNGITWVDLCPSTVSASVTAYDDCIAVTGTGGSPPVNSALSSNVTETYRGATPFTVYAEFDASPVGLDSLGLRALAETNLQRVESFVVEQAFWTGQAGGQPTVWPHLASAGTLSDPNGITLQTAASQTVTGTGVDAATALGQLETQLAASYGGQGVIHIPRQALSTFRAWKLVLLNPDDGKLYTPAGNLVVAGGGYTGSSPAGSAATSVQVWIYATGAVFGYRSDIEIMQMPGTFDRSKNTVKRLAMRTYCLGWECAHLAANVLLGVPT